MPQVINTNISSLNAQRQLNRSQTSMHTAMERLSSGLRINSARDDAAGLAISDRMTAQVRGLNQAVRNANDGISIAQVTEGALQETTNILQRMRELAVQSANDSNSASDRANLQKEVIQLQAEINRIADTTTFNGKKMLDGTFISQKFHVGAFANESIDVTVGSARADAIGNQALVTNGSGTIAVAAATTFTAAASKVLAGEDLIVAGSLGTKTATVNAGDSAKVVADSVNSLTETTGVTADAASKATISNVGTAGTVSFNLYGSNATGILISAALADKNDLTNLVTAINSEQAATGITAVLSADKMSLTLTNEAGHDIGIENTANAGSASATNAVFSLAGLTAGGTATSAVVLNGVNDSSRVTGYLNFESSQIYSVTSGAAGALFNNTSANGSTLDNVAAINISTQQGSNDALSVIDGALQFIANTRADLGAVQNRFSSTIANLENVSQNVSAARSRIQDADFAMESADLARTQILQQAGISMLAQANASTQNVLNLLQG